MNSYHEKIDKYILPLINKITNPVIFEMGVRDGISTKKFIDVCEKNNGELYSVDILDYSNVSNNKKWKFIKDSDKNLENYIDQLPKKFDLIYLDSLHEANHVEKILYLYFDLLKNGGYFVIDDISHLPYTTEKKNNNFYCEINNKETFNRVLDIYNNNTNNFELEFKFLSSGLAIIKKINENKLNKKIILRTRELSMKNLLRTLWKMAKKK
ncbi:MAG: class I SAM-dependent methyltransferase [Candidatus Pelagibacter sp. TMED118]|nr:MAG: class I SAM-dependent methyltransferase [Candidatus Pelagibacter sp. TMED118]|tara:strand:+ start:285 stop:917 length:633 start_codon:yes stop_codon:yes gene_type:complete